VALERRATPRSSLCALATRSHSLIPWAAYKGSSDEFIDANLQLAVAAAKQLSAGGASVQILVPDVPELTRAEERLGPSLALLDGVSFGSLSGSRAGRLSDFFFKPPGSAAESLTRAADVYLVCNCSAIELPTLQSFVEDPGRCAPTAVVCLFNCELETHRGDLGLPGFPPKSLHNGFLSRILPVFFLRQRAYSKTVNVAPFLLNYSGATFREYPAPWQVLLRTDSGQMACIAERTQRYGLGEAKEEMMAAMGLNTEEEGSAIGFLRRGRTIRTWWEEENGEEKSVKWRS